MRKLSTVAKKVIRQERAGAAKGGRDATFDNPARYSPKAAEIARTGIKGREQRTKDLWKTSGKEKNSES